jgi:GNAT superfamily N-acetyltransferase
MRTDQKGITIKEAKTKKEMKQFVTFPFSLYATNKFWVPPIIKDELEGFDRNKNPVFKHAEAQFFLAIKNTKIVGRVAAIINHTEVNQQKIKKMRFGWFDVIDDVEVTKLLLSKVYEIGKQNNLEFIEGPVGFSNLDKVGLLIKGFDHIGTMITWYNHAYYAKHLESLGYVKEKEHLENQFLISSIDKPYYSKIANLIKKRYKLKELSFTKTKNLMPYVSQMFTLFNETYANLSTFIPVSNDQIEYYKTKYISFINPEYIKFVFNENNKMIGFGIIMPSFSKALQKANGKLFPFGIYHLLKAKKKNDTVISYLIGVHPDYQNKGVTAIIFDELLKSVTKNGIKYVKRTPELEDNKAISKIWRNFNQKTHKRRRTYKLEIT